MKNGKWEDLNINANEGMRAGTAAHQKRQCVFALGLEIRKLGEEES